MGSELVRVTKRMRRGMEMRASENRRRQEDWQRRRGEASGPGACTGCGSPPCGHLWPEARCCADCSHESVPHFEATHAAFVGGRRRAVMEIRFGPRDRGFLREDGVVELLELNGGDAAMVAFLGREPVEGCALYPAESDDESGREDEWAGRKPLDWDAHEGSVWQDEEDDGDAQEGDAEDDDGEDDDDEEEDDEEEDEEDEDGSE